MKILNNLIAEAGANVNRLRKHIVEDKIPFLIGTAYRSIYTNSVNKQRNKSFIENYVKHSGLTFIQIKGKWEEAGTGKVSEERSFFIMGKKDGSDDKKLIELAKILVKSPIPEEDNELLYPKLTPTIVNGKKLEGYNQDAVVIKLTDDDNIYLFDKDGKVDADWGNLGDIIDKRTEEEIYSTIKGNDFSFKKSVKELLEIELSHEIKLNPNPDGMAGHLLENKKLEILN